jgi:O-Antigen ligase
MTAFPGIIGLIIFLYVRPQEFFEPLKDFNFLYIFLFLSVAGLANDVSRKRTKLMVTPHLRYAAPFVLWCIFTLGIRKPAEVAGKATLIIVCLILYAIMATGIQTIKSFQRMLLVVFSCGLFVAFVGAHQGLSPFQCVVYNPADKNSMSFPDGRECAVVDDEGLPHDGTVDCMASGKAGMAYECERAGLFGTTSCGGGRVRYLGVLLDPNELSLATAIAVPMAFALLELRWSFLRLLLLMGTLATVGLEIVFTQSRGGQLTMGAVLGTYFVKKYGWKRGALVGVALAVPMVALGGRHSESAEESTLERLGCAAAGIKMLMAYPFRGVGYSQYTENHFLTAHNAYVLACGELGLLGMWIFGMLIFLGIKVPLAVLQFPMDEEHPETTTIKTLAMAMLAAMIGLSIGIFFLSWCYHYVLWMHWAMCGSLYCCVKRIYPTFDVKVSRKDKGLVFAGYVGFLLFWTYYIRSKGAWD